VCIIATIWSGKLLGQSSPGAATEPELRYAQQALYRLLGPTSVNHKDPHDSQSPSQSHIRQWSTAAVLAAAGAAMFGVAGLPAARADDGALTPDIGLLAASSDNQYDPAVFDYSADPSNLFSPVYTITPTGPEDVEVTDASGDVFGTQDFTLSDFGIPVGTFTGNVEYSPTSSPLDLFGNPYVEDINVAGVPGTLLPENTGFLVEEFGAGYGNVLEESMNAAGTSDTVGDFLLTPFGDENITPIVDFFLNYTGTPLTDAAGAVDPSSVVDLLSSIGL
jgi:hypothetical protein